MTYDSYLAHQGRTQNPSLKQLARKAATIVALSTMCGCARQPPLEFDLSDQPPWVVDAFNRAAFFWARHDITINNSGFDNPDAIKVEIADVSNSEGSGFGQWRHNENTIRLSPLLESDSELRSDEFDRQLQFCVVSHEIGHIIGMDHVEDPNSLMFEDSNRPVDADGNPTGGCFWSADDQIELCRVQGCEEESPPTPGEYDE